MKNKNKYIIVITNILLLILVFCVAEFLAYKEASIYLKQSIKYTWKKEDYSLDNLKKSMRTPCGLKYKKPPILIYGCSYAYGFGLNEENTFGYKLSQKAKRPVYNYAMSSKGFQDALFLLEHDEKVVPEPEYIFYVFINDHIRRMFINCNKIDYMKYLTYKNQNDKLVQNENKYAVSERLYIFGVIKNALYYFFKNIFKKPIYRLTKKYIYSINQEIKMKYPNAKFIIIDYDNGAESYFSFQKKEELKKQGIEVIQLNKEFKGILKSEKYRNSINEDIFRHPNSKAWDLIVPYLVSKYNL